MNELINSLRDASKLEDVLILDSENQWLATCSYEDLEDRLKEIKTFADEVYIYKARLLKTITK